MHYLSLSLGGLEEVPFLAAWLSNLAFYAKRLTHEYLQVNPTLQNLCQNISRRDMHSFSEDKIAENSLPLRIQTAGTDI